MLNSRSAESSESTLSTTEPEIAAHGKCNAATSARGMVWRRCEASRSAAPEPCLGKPAGGVLPGVHPRPSTAGDDPKQVRAVAGAAEQGPDRPKPERPAAHLGLLAAAFVGSIRRLALLGTARNVLQLNRLRSPHLRRRRCARRAARRRRRALHSLRAILQIQR